MIGMLAALLLPSGALATCGVLLVTNTRPTGGGNVLKYSQCTGEFLGDLISAGPPGNLVEPDTMLIGPDGMLYITSGVTDTESAVKKFDSETGEFLGDFATGNGMRRPYGIAFDGQGNLYVASFRSDQLLRFDSSGNYIDEFAVGTSTADGLNGPNGLAFGPDGKLYVTTQGSVADGIGGISYLFASQIISYDIQTGVASVFAEPGPGSNGFTSMLGLEFTPECALGASDPDCFLFASDFAGQILKYSVDSDAASVTFPTDYGGGNFVGAVTIGSSGDALYSVGFTDIGGESPGAILKYNVKGPQGQEPLVVAGGMDDEAILKRPIGILALPRPTPPDFATSPSQPPAVPPAAPPTVPPTQPPSAPPSLPPSVPPAAPPSMPPSQPPSMPPGQPPSVPPAAPP